MIRDTAGQVVGVQMVSAADGSAYTGAVTAYVTLDGGTQAIGSVGSGACAHEGQGYHTYAPSQAETDGAQIAFTFVGVGALPKTVKLYTRAVVEGQVTEVASETLQQDGRDRVTQAGAEVAQAGHATRVTQAGAEAAQALHAVRVTQIGAEIAQPNVPPPQEPVVDVSIPCCETSCHCTGGPGSGTPTTGGAPSSPGSRPPPNATGPQVPAELPDPWEGPYWLAACLGGGLVPSAADPVDAEVWAH